MERGPNDYDGGDGPVPDRTGPPDVRVTTTKILSPGPAQRNF
jgi:hypothetical protein